MYTVHIAYIYIILHGNEGDTIIPEYILPKLHVGPYCTRPACLEWRGCGSGMGMGWGWGRAHPFETSPPGCLERVG